MTSQPNDHFREPSERQRESNPPTHPPSTSRFAALSSLLQRHKDLLHNAGSLLGTTGITSIFGFVYWIYAARFFSTDAVGYATAAISTMMLLGTIGEFGIGTMLIGELSRARDRGGLITASMMASFIISFALGLGFALVSMVFGNHFAEVNGTVGRVALFSFGTGITGATLVFDEATIGLMRGGIQLRRNVTVSIAKMAALPAASLLLNDKFGVGIMLSWVVGTVFSLLPTAITIKRTGARIAYRPDWSTFWANRKITLAHNSLNLAISTPARLIPVLVAMVVPPSPTGAYYIATMISSFLTMVPSSLSTVLFAIAAAAPEMMPEKLRFVLRTSLYIGVPGGLVMGLSAHFVLSIFGSSYATLATGPLWLLIVGYIPNMFNSMYITVSRATGQVNKAAVFFLVFLALRAGALVVGGKIGGLYGLSYAMLAILIVQALISGPKVLAIAYGSAQVRAAITSDQTRLRSVESTGELRLRQEAGLTLLAALAAAASPSPHLAETATHGLPKLNSTQPNGRHRRSAAPETTVRQDPADTSWWPDADEATFRYRQETGMAALIEIATHAARY